MYKNKINKLYKNVLFLSIMSILIFINSCTNMKLKVGDKAPLFSLQNQDGKLISLENLIQNSILVLYFYPKDETTGCTAEACKFRDDYEIFKDNGAEVVGISSDSKESHIQFIKNHNLPFQLLSDINGKIRKKYSVPKTMGLIPSRVTYIISKEGIILHIFNSQFNPKKHIDEAIEVIKHY